MGQQNRVDHRHPVETDVLCGGPGVCNIDAPWPAGTRWAKLNGGLWRAHPIIRRATVRTHTDNDKASLYGRASIRVGYIKRSFA